jgi:hypothetical protein
MLSKLTFKKAFGLKIIPSDYALWLIELGNVECTFSIADKKFTVKIGRFGITEQEKIIISYFFHADKRDPKHIHEVVTLDITFDIDLEVPETQQAEGPRNEKIDSAVAPFIQDAFTAASRFIDANRSAKHKVKHGSEDWRKGKALLIPEIRESEFKTYLFYQLQSSGKTFVGCFSEGQMTISSFTDNALIEQQMQAVVQDEIPLRSKLIVKAWEYLFQEDFHNSVIYAATVLELTIVGALRKNLISKAVASNSRIDTFLDDVSNRLLCTVMLGLIGISNEELREKVASVFDIRNGLVHGKRKKVSRTEAETVLNDTEALLEQLERLS